LIAPAAAVETIVQQNIQQFNVGAPENHVISGVHLNNIAPNFNATVDFDAYGEQYILRVNNTKNIGWWTFYVSLQYPNGTIASTELKSFQPFASDAEVKIQYFYAEADSVLDVDVFVGLLPLTASFTNLIDADSQMGQLLAGTGTTYTRLAFSNVAGECTEYFDLKVYISTWEEFNRQRSESVGEYLRGSTSLLFSWAWSMILSFVAAIPGLGPYLEAMLIITAAILSEVVFYVDLLFIQYPETTILTIEFFILSSALLQTRKRDGIITIVERIVSAHIKVVMFFYITASLAVDIFTKMVRMVADIVGAIK
jgi:hypothetical protein